MNLKAQPLLGEPRAKLVKWLLNPQCYEFAKLLQSKATFLEWEAINLTQKDLGASISKAPMPETAMEKLAEAAMLRSVVLEFEKLREHAASEENSVEFYIPE